MNSSALVPDEPIRDVADWQTDWSACLPALAAGEFDLQPATFLSVHGEAPKGFLRIREKTPGQLRIARRSEKWPAYIAKVGYKWYPTESITEHFITRVGQICGLNIADSKLVIVGRQVRFLSRYFLDDKNERLSHGLDLMRPYFDREEIERIAQQKKEHQSFSFQLICRAFQELFAEQNADLTREFVKLLAFDALTGNNDRHPANWGVIVPLSLFGDVKFAPIFDSARGLCWRQTEAELQSMERDAQKFDAYIRKSQPQIAWEGHEGKRLNHFEFMNCLAREYPDHAANLLPFFAPEVAARAQETLENEFADLMTPLRQRIVLKTLERRLELLRNSLQPSA